MSSHTLYTSEVMIRIINNLSRFGKIPCVVVIPCNEDSSQQILSNRMASETFFTILIVFFE